MSNLLSLEQFRRIVKMNPYHFWQLANEEIPVNNPCDDLLYEEDWQNSDAMSRSGIREAISMAERKVREWLRYDVAPRYQTAIVDWPRRVNQTEWRGWDVNAIDRSISVSLPWGQVRSVGYRTQSLQASPAVVVTDDNGDGVLDSFTATFATALTSATDLVAYFTPSDRWDETRLIDDYKIAPLTISISGGVATVKGKAWQIVRPILYANDVASVTLDPDDTDTYVESIAIYREYSDPNGETVETSQATLIWETNPAPWGWCYASNGASPYTPNASDPAAVGKAVARVGIRNAALGIVTPDQAVRDDTTGEWRRVTWSTGYEPDRVEVRYFAGLDLVDGQMDRTWQEMIAYLALAELEGPICACESVRARLHYWQFDLARTGGSNDESYAISAEDLDNPLGGTRRGHIHAWKRIKNLRQLIGYSF